ncbi:alpha/beta fold hydrolase [Rhizobium paknamense]|uniref:Pimeloyl-ACP methyl ester carboxylesterase n=1 Tax=Rhizobium paknamense TaxID=1206817 RepID=A0ABU0ID66_9HYPH|nr:alpha/beta hydrolase [Rhizobium paknamense]MDQ0456193.1 pimeloyl-ACP methyl ester carboxylesterase [Rhizobium paknamense]
MKDTVISTATIRMSIIEAGKGPLVLLCHGFPETKYAWRHQIEALARVGYRAVAPDMRGYGKSESPERADQYTVFHAVGDLVALLDALGERQAVVVGHDWGATIAWQAALMRPDRFRAVVALSVPMMGQPPVPPSQIFPQDDSSLFYTLYFQDPNEAEAEFGRDVALTLRKLIFAASGEAGPRLPGDSTPNPFGMVSRSTGLLKSLPEPATLPDWLPALDFDRLVKDFEVSGFRGGLNYYRNLDRNWELQHLTAGLPITIPALFMIGERDTGLSVPGMNQIIAAMPTLVPDLRGSHVIPDAGHWLQQERPNEVSGAILSFLECV